MATTYGYIRVSTKEQEYLRQQDALIRVKGIPEENIFEEKISGTKEALGRTQFDLLMKTVKAGDTIVFESISRLARTVQDILNTSLYLKDTKKVNQEFVKEAISIPTESVMGSIGSLYLNIMATFAQLERDQISERTAQGMRAKREKLGDSFNPGRPTVYDKKEVIAISDLREKGYTILEISEILKLNKSTVGRVTKQLKQDGALDKMLEKIDKREEARAKAVEEAIAKAKANGTYDERDFSEEGYDEENKY